MTTETFVFRDKYATYEELEKDKRIYDFMSYRQRLISNDKSIKLYGDDNLSRYNDMKYDFLKQMNPRSIFFDDSIYIGTMVSEAGSDPGFSISDLTDNWEDKIARAIEAENSGLIMAIIIDTAIEEYTLDTLALLTEKYTSFTMLNENLRNLSNQTALDIFGLDNYNLYTTIKNYVLTKFDTAAAISPDEITSYRMAVNVESSNPLDSLLRRLDIKKELEGDKLSLYESIAFNGIRNSLVKPKEDIAPEFVPFFTPDEMEDFGVNSGEVNLYSPEPDNDMVGDIPIAEWFEKYRQTNGYMENSKDWYLTLQKLYSDYDSLKEAAAGEEEYINEGYVLNKSNLYVNFDKFERGEINYCFVTGLSGSGKSTLSKKLASKYNGTVIGLDWFYMIPNTRDYNIMAEKCEPLYDFFMARRPLYFEVQEGRIKGRAYIELLQEFIEYTIHWCGMRRDKKFFIEGIQVFGVVHPSIIKDDPIVFVNSSMLRSMIRSVRRSGVKITMDGDFGWWLNWCIDSEQNFTAFKKAIMKEETISPVDVLNSRKQSILELGWNPELDFNTDILRGAKIRNYEYLKEHLPIVVDLTRYYENYTEDTHSALYEANERLRDIVTSKLKPIYITLSYTGTNFGKLISKWTDSVYTHSSLSLDSTMKKLYTFSTWVKDKKINTGLTVESVDDYIRFNDGSKISVLAVFVTEDQHNKVKEALDYFIAHANETKYSFKNIFNIMINKSVDTGTQLKLVCSQFVDVILKMANINLVSKSSNLVTPKDFYIVDDPKVFKLYDGPAKDYNKMKIDKMIDDLRVKPDTTRLSTTNLENAVDVLYYADTIKKIKGVKLDDDVYKQVIDLLSADTVIKEARLGLNVNKDGDVELTKPKDINAEFFRSNRILKRYKANGNAEGIKYELAKLMYLDTITDKNKGKKEYMDAKARINNTIKTYLEFIAIKEPDFNMSEYYEKSEFYHGKITIGKNTVKSIAALGKALIRR